MNNYNTIEKSKDIFDELYVIFTDYTGKEERKVEKERRDKDPILFGVFKNDGNVADRFYFLGDWVDEYCDLTLDKMVEQYKNKKGVSPKVETSIPQNGEELVELLKRYKIDEKKENSVIHIENNLVPVTPFYLKSQEESKKGFFSKIRSVFKTKK